MTFNPNVNYMFKWNKLGRVFNPSDIKDRFWLKEFAQAPSVLIFDTFIRVYFSCRPNKDENGLYVSYTGFVDFNRFKLDEIIRVSENPILELGELGTFDEFGTYPVSVIRNGEEVLAYYAGWSRCESVHSNVAIGLAKSNDNGVTFTKVGKGPLISYALQEPFILSGPKIRRFNNQWYLWYIAGKKWINNNGKPEIVYRIRMATSHDGINWIRDYKDLIEVRLEENECQASPDVIFYKGKYHMFFSYKYALDFRGNDKGYRIGYASSDNMVDWVRDDTKAGIEKSKEGFDDQSIAYPHVFELDNQLYMLYLGNDVGKFGFGLAKLEDE